MKKVPAFLLFAFLVIWLLLAIRPYDRSDWWLENLLVFVGLPLVIFLYRKDELSLLSCFFLFLFLTLHSIGAHYTYSEVPLGYTVSSWFGEQRNHYDRLVHFLFGFLLTVPAGELITKTTKPTRAGTLFYSFTVICTLGLLYELLEWGVAVTVDPGAGSAFLGSQGDEWDAQKDLFMKVCGSLLSLLSFNKTIGNP